MNSQKPQEVFNMITYAGVLQDKATLQRSYKASGESSYSSPPAQLRQKHHGSQKRKLVEVSGCVTRQTFNELERMREQGGEKLSRSSVVGTLVTRGVQGNVDMQYGSMLEPVIKNEIKKNIGGYSNHIAFLAVNAFYKSAKTDFKLDELLLHILRDSSELKKIQTEARIHAHAVLSQKRGEKE